ncbi:MAG: L,D-transpeptidase family protein, partial [Pseudomonadota bacterium]
QRIVEPAFPLSFDPHYPEIALRGLAEMLPDLQAYFGRAPRPYVDGGYYTKTKENRPLVGPLPVEGAYLIAHIPSFPLYGFRSSPNYEKPDLVMKIIVGQSINKRSTPIFHAEMHYIVFRPYWNIPYSITVKEMLPEIAANPAYVGRNDLEIVDRFSDSAKIFPATPENLYLLHSGALKLRQRPGPRNALGLAKFIFPNHNSVYLHSTPAQQLFSRSRRDFSHGCIRVEDPVALAEFVLGKEKGWDRERILTAMNGRRTKRVPLKSPVEVYIFYSTVLVDENDNVLFYEDIYGHDETLQQLLDTGYPFPA